MNWKRLITVFVCMLIVNLPIIMADAYSNGAVSPAPVAAGVLIVGLAIAVPVIMSYIVSAGMVSGAVYAECADSDEGSYYNKGTCIDDDTSVGGCVNGCSDGCVDIGTLREVNCVSGKCSYTPYDCESGYECANGACVIISGGSSGPASVRVILMSGEEKINGYRRPIDDYTYVEAEVSFGDGRTVNAENVKLESEGAYSDFESCSRIEPLNKYLCIYQSSVNSNYYMSGRLNFNVMLFDDPSDTTMPADSDSTGIVIDSKPPEILSLTTPEQQGKNITFSYSLQDEADISSKTSGIMKAVYRVGSFKIGERVFNTTDKRVSVSTESLLLETSEPNSEEGVELTLTAYDRVGNEIDAVTDTFVVDNKPPEVLEGSFYIKDKSGNVLQSLPEDGLKGATIGASIRSGNGLFGVKALVSPLSSSYAAGQWMDGSCGSPLDAAYKCIWSGVDVDKSGNMNAIMINGSDNLGNVMSQSIGDYVVSVERDAPMLISGSLKIYFSGTTDEVQYLGNYSKDIESKKVDIYLNLSEEYPGINNAGVVLDLSDLGGSDTNYASKCTHVIFKQDITGIILDHYYTCFFSNVDLELSGDINSMDFTFSDLFGNENEVRAGKSIRFDDEAPVVTYLGAGHNYEGEEWIGPDDEFLVRIKETGSGINETNVEFTLPGQNPITAEKCTFAGDSWTCTAPVSGIEESMHLSSIDLSVEVTDNIGYNEDNEARKRTTLIIDAKAPEIVDMKILSTGFVPEKLTSGEGLLINITINDSISVSGTANLSQLNCEPEGNIRCPENEDTYGDCEWNETGDEMWTCIWRVSQVFRRATPDDPSDFSDVNFWFNITDLAGNRIMEISPDHKVYGLISEVPPDNFDVVVEDSSIFPQKINRLTASLLPEGLGIKVNVPFYMVYRGSTTAEVLKQELRDCIICPGCVLDSYFHTPGGSCKLDEDCDNVPLARKAVQATTDTNNKNYNRAEFRLADFMEQADVERLNRIDDFVLNCTLYTYQLVGDSIYKEPEKDNIQVPFDFVDSALDGKPDQEYRDKIDKLRNSMLADQDWITKVAEWFGILESICSIGQKIQQVMGVIASVEAVGAALQEVPYTPVEKAGKVLYAGACYIYEFVGMIYNPIWYGKDAIGQADFKRCPTGGAGAAADTADTAADTAESFKETAVDTLKEAINPDNWELSGRFLCGWITCEYSNEFWSYISGEKFTRDLLDKSGVGDVVDNVDDFIQDVTSGTMSGPSFSTSMDAKSSLITSVGTLCLGGIFYNLNKMRQIQCRYINCMREVSINGGDTSFCDAKKQESWCLLVFGEFYNLFAPVQMWDSFITSLSDMFADAAPSTILQIADAKVCGSLGEKILGKKAHKWVKTIWCDIVGKTFDIIDSTQRMAGLGEYADQSYWSISSNIPDECPQAMCDNWVDGKCLDGEKEGEE